MANPEHLEVARRGAEAIRGWRDAHPDQGLDLRRADLGAADLSGVDLGAADLSVADLSGANLRRAVLNAADVSYVMFGGTTLSGLDLSKTRGLDSCQHFGPSVFDVETLQRSRDLPEVFLQGIGLPDDMIDLYRSWQGAIRYYSCFISYSTRDQAFANRLHADLQARGVRCWLATEDLKIGQRNRAAIFDAIRLHDKTVIVLSEHSVGSDWVRDEVEAALDRERTSGVDKLFPVRLDETVLDADVDWAITVRQRHIGDFRRWGEDQAEYSRQFERLLRDLSTQAD